jgi:DNA-directed RNA polymerase
MNRQFLERYKNHRIPVDLAMMVIRSHRKRRAKSLEKDEEIIDADAEVEERELTTGNAMEEDLETNLPDEKAKPRLKNFGVRDLKDEQGNQILPEIIGGKKFLKLSDVLPPAPPRGEFDVNKIRLSPYFFS